MIARLLAVLLFVAPPVFACTATLDVSPARPTAIQPVKLSFRGGCPNACTPRSPRLSVVGTTINVDFEASGQVCLSVGSSWQADVPVQPLPPANYSVVARLGATELLRTTLEVTHAPILPSYGRSGTEILIEYPGIGEGTPTVTFGNTAARSVRVISSSKIAAVVPFLQQAVYDVGATAANTSFVAGRAFRYGFPTEADSTVALFPLSLEGPGAQNSRWTTDSWIRNDAPIAVDVYPIGAVPAGSRLRIPTTTRGSNVLARIPLGLEEQITVSSHVRDTSRAGENNGTELKVARASDLKSALRIVGVPADPRFRATLRIYSLDGVANRSVTVTATPPSGGAVSRTISVINEMMCMLPETWLCGPQTEAAFAVVDLSTLGIPAGAVTVDLRIESTGRNWAFVSVTSNETQMVTTYSPQH